MDLSAKSLIDTMHQEHKDHGVFIEVYADFSQKKKLIVLPEMPLPSNITHRNLIAYRPLTRIERRQIKLRKNLTFSDQLQYKFWVKGVKEEVLKEIN